jgi:hypothetical protein
MIKQKGCSVSSAAMLLGYHGVNVDPPTLNQWLKMNNGYNRAGNIDWFRVAAYGRKAGKEITYIDKPTGTLEQNICEYGPQIINVKNAPLSHFVSVTGRDSEKTTWLINDPNGGVSTTLNKYNNIISAKRIFSGPEHTFTDPTGLVVHLHSPAELVITNPLGQRLGTDPITGTTYNEIPHGYYNLLGDIDDDDPDDALLPDPEPDPTKEIEIFQPVAGQYTLDVIGTGAGAYSMEITTYDPELNQSQAAYENLPIYPGNIQSFKFNFLKTVGSQTEFSGTFDGGGQRPKDVNKFLTYSSPTQSQTTLPSGVANYQLMVFYDKSVLPGSFDAELNGIYIGDEFHPVPGSAEIVNLYLQPGRNALKLSIQGTLSNGRIAADTDRLVFIVQ